MYLSRCAPSAQEGTASMGKGCLIRIKKDEEAKTQQGCRGKCLSSTKKRPRGGCSPKKIIVRARAGTLTMERPTISTTCTTCQVHVASCNQARHTHGSVSVRLSYPPRGFDKRECSFPCLLGPLRPHPWSFIIPADPLLSDTRLLLWQNRARWAEMLRPFKYDSL